MIAKMAVLAAAVGVSLAASSKDDIGRADWLAGCWERRTASGSVEEQWMSARGGAMLGMSRTVRADSIIEYEFIRLFEQDAKLIYEANPSGQRTTEFTASAVTDSMMVFENAAHDFPQRIIYRRAGADSLHARIEGRRGGATRGVDFRYARVGCPGR